MTEQQMMSESEFFAELKEIDSEMGGGGGYIGHITFEMGYNSFATGLPPAERWFSFPSRNQPARKEALSAAKALGADVGVSYCFKMKKSTVKNRDVSAWQHEYRYWIIDTWKPDAVNIVLPALVKQGLLNFPQSFWGRITAEQSKDPKSVDKNGEPKWIGYATEIFTDEAAADVAGSKGASTEDAIPGSSAAEGPPAWLVDYVNDPEHPERQKAKPIDLAGELGQPVEMIIAALGA